MFNLKKFIKQAQADNLNPDIVRLIDEKEKPETKLNSQAMNLEFTQDINSVIPEMQEIINQENNSGNKNYKFSIEQGKGFVYGDDNPTLKFYGMDPGPMPRDNASAQFLYTFNSWPEAESFANKAKAQNINIEIIKPTA